MKASLDRCRSQVSDPAAVTRTTKKHKGAIDSQKKTNTIPVKPKRILSNKNQHVEHRRFAETPQTTRRKVTPASKPTASPFPDTRIFPQRNFQQSDSQGNVNVLPVIHTSPFPPPSQNRDTSEVIGDISQHYFIPTKTPQIMSVRGQPERKSFEGNGKCASRTFTPRSKRESGVPWSVVKRDQSKRQKRAFSTNGDNPFAVYNHDPNDAESRLDSLSSSVSPRATESVIPSDQLRGLDAAYRNIEKHNVRRGSLDGPISRRFSRRPAGARAQPSVSVLAQKAEEHNQYARASRSPRNGGMATHTYWVPSNLENTQGSSSFFDEQEHPNPTQYIYETTTPGIQLSPAGNIVQRVNPNQYGNAVPWETEAHEEDVEFMLQDVTQDGFLEEDAAYMEEEQAYLVPHAVYPALQPQATGSQTDEAWSDESYPQLENPFTDPPNLPNNGRCTLDPSQETTQSPVDWQSAFYS